ncbi:helix-turn-helix domain-containing protein [Enterococcus sp. DIV0756]|uniref:helix-turn-helix domain-containing protein n=1 Tax=Enterococcus sp. DIV0756 TaxID=2774636 RepID=UPI003F27EB12
MKSILLSDDSKKKIEIFLEMNNLEDGKYSISTIINLLRFSKNTVYHLLESIAIDLDTLFNYKLFDENGKIIWSKKAFDMNRYNQFLLQKSLPYKFILFILRNPDKTLEDFCSASFTSASTIRRTLQPFLTFLKKFEIKVNLSSMKLEGNEYEIRMLFHTVLWSCSLGQGIISVQENVEKEEEVLKKLGFADCPYINTNDILTILLIAKLRIQNNFPVLEPPASIDFVPVKTTDVLLDYLSSFISSTALLEAEVRSIVFQIYFSNLYFHKDDVRVTDIHHYYLEKKKGSKFIPVIDKLFRRLDLNTDHNRTLPLVNLISIFLSFSLNRRPLPWMNEFSDYEVLFPSIAPQKITTVEAFFSKISCKKEFNWLSKYPPEFYKYVYYILNPYIVEKSLNVKVAIVPIPNHRIMSELDHFLSLFSFVDVSYNDQADSDIDLFISTFESLVPDETTSFFLVSTNELSLETKNHLFSIMYKLYFEKKEKA